MKRLTATLVLIFTLLTSACGFEIVDPGHRGVKITTGKIDTTVLSPDFYTYNPFISKIIEVDVRTQRAEGKTNTYTKDVQQANLTYVVEYNLKPEATAVTIENVGRDWDAKLVPQAVEGSLKQIIGQYDAADLIAHRSKATDESLNRIRDTLAAKHVDVTAFQLVNIAYLAEYEKAVEAKVIATQKAQEAINNTLTIRENAKQQLITAEATAASMRIQAQALTQNAGLTQYEAVKKWDGKLPVNMYGSAPVPFINLK